MADDLRARLKQFFETGAPGVVSVYLFGSHAEGRSHRESDLDIGILLDWECYPDRRRRFDAKLHLAAEVGHVLGRTDVDIVILNDAPPLLARAIVSRGIRLCCRHTDTDHAFVRTAFLRAADLEPFLRRARRVKLDAIRR
jgi:hypothetical protein